jgi:hypothetical protein
LQLPFLDFPTCIAFLCALCVLCAFALRCKP